MYVNMSLYKYGCDCGGQLDYHPHFTPCLNMISLLFTCMYARLVLSMGFQEFSLCLPSPYRCARATGLCCYVKDMWG